MKSWLSLKFLIKFFAGDYSEISIPIPIPIPHTLVIFNSDSNSNSMSFNSNSNSNSGIGIGITCNSNSKLGIGHIPANDHIFSMKISVWCGTLEVNSTLKHGFHIHFGRILVLKKNRKKMPKKDLTRRQKIKPARVTGNKQFFF